MQLEVKNICKSKHNKMILNSISFSINSGEISILIGKSGVGKTTILRILNNLEDFDSGQILLNQKNINTYGENQIGIVFQSFNLFSNLSVIENITLALIHVKKISKEEASRLGYELLKKYNLLDKAQTSPQNLSGGEKQKIAIIRTIAMQPKVICLDEPFSALDPRSTHQIIEFIKKLQSEQYIIIITTHNMEILKKLDASIHLIDNGKIIKTVESNAFFNSNNKEENSILKKFIDGQLYTTEK